MSLQDLMDKTFETTAGSMTLRELLDSENPTVFIAYPMDYSPVCTMQLKSYCNNWDKLSELPVNWWGINMVSVKKHASYKETMNLPFELISDPKADLLKALNLYGALQTKRGFAVISKEGEVYGDWSIFPFIYDNAQSVVQKVYSYLPEELQDQVK